jgi:Fe-S-cluster formation regulator IscX/YfhJ
MTKYKIILSAAVVVVSAFVAYASYEGPLQALMERFPDIDPKIVRKVHREMFKEALVGKYSEFQTDDATLDRIFLVKVQELTSK